MTDVALPAIHLDQHGVAWLEGTKVKVIEIVLDHTARGWSAEEIHEKYPHLSLAQIRSALGYYADHREELAAEIERRYQEVQALRAAAGDSPIRARLRELGHTP